MKWIKLTRNKRAKVSNSDYSMLIKYRWYADSNTGGKIWYAATSICGKTVRMHRLIMGLTDPKIYGEHRNHNGLDNRRGNLRIANNSQNMMNARGYGRSKYLGVCWHIEKWQAKIKAHGKYIHLGLFKNEITAAGAYDKAARKYHGKFANPNFK